MLNDKSWANIIRWFEYMEKLIGPAILSTLRMVMATMIFGFIIGFSLAVLLIYYGPEGLKPKRKVYWILDFFINTIRSFPILILIVAVSPITRMVVGTIVGEKAAVLPLVIASTAFIARALENTFKEVDKQLIEAARSFGASNLNIVFRVIIKETVPSIINVVTLSTITYIAGSTIAGSVGGGGLGAVALNYGYQSFNNVILYTCVIILLLMVQITQAIGTWIYKRKI